MSASFSTSVDAVTRAKLQPRRLAVDFSESNPSSDNSFSNVCKSTANMVLCVSSPNVRCQNPYLSPHAISKFMCHTNGVFAFVNFTAVRRSARILSSLNSATASPKTSTPLLNSVNSRAFALQSDNTGLCFPVPSVSTDSTKLTLLKYKSHRHPSPSASPSLCPGSRLSFGGIRKTSAHNIWPSCPSISMYSPRSRKPARHVVLYTMALRTEASPEHTRWHVGGGGVVMTLVQEGHHIAINTYPNTATPRNAQSARNPRRSPPSLEISGVRSSRTPIRRPTDAMPTGTKTLKRPPRFRRALPRIARVVLRTDPESTE